MNRHLELAAILNEHHKYERDDCPYCDINPILREQMHSKDDLQAHMILLLVTSLFIQDT